jgi:Co/Zn/Cd efflux system component
MNKLLAAAAALTATWAQAHEGHGLSGAHWHATDAFGFVAVIAGVAAVMWWRGRK